MKIDSTYEAEDVALLTQHGKEKVIAPVLKNVLGCNVIHVSGYDTDKLGTFTRDITRRKTQKKTALKKARIGMKLSGLSLGIASEGSFGMDPLMGLYAINIETLVWVDKKQKLEVVALAKGRTNLDHMITSQWNELETFAKKVGFPEHYLVMRTDHEKSKVFQKGISDWDTLSIVFRKMLDSSKKGKIFVETDMRAHANPTRMKVIEECAHNLAKQLSSICVKCGAAGFWIINHEIGLPCSSCGRASSELLAYTYGCQRCSHKERVEYPEGKMKAYPGNCQWCNP